MKNMTYGGFAACYIASTLDPEKVEQEDQKAKAEYVSKPRTKRKYKK